LIVKTEFLKKVYIPLLAVLLVILLGSCSSRINTTEKLVNAMIERYSGKWFKQISFDQTTTFYQNGKATRTESWQEVYKFPSMLLISYDQGQSGSGQLYRNDSLYVFENYQIVETQKIIHDLLVLSMDIYNLNTENAIARIGELGYDKDKFYTRMYNNRKVYVVGAQNEKDSSDQFWIDAEHLYFVKMIKKRDYGVQEVEMRNYIEIENNGWIEQEVVFKINGEVYLIEKYYNIRIPENEPDDNMFSPSVISSRDVLQRVIRSIDLPDFNIIDLNRKVYITIVEKLF